MKWPVLPLARICRIEIGRTPSRAHPEYFGGDNVWVTIADLNDGTVCESKEHVTDDAVSKARMRPVPVGTVLLSYKLSLGKLGIAGTNLFTNEAIAALPSRPGVEIVAKYLFYALRTVDYLALCHGAVKGKCLNRASLNRIPVPLPPLSEQQRIVEILDQADALRKKRAEADAKAARILPALFYKMFGDPATNPRNWNIKSLGQVIRGKPQYGANASAVEWLEGMPRYVRITDITQDGRLLKSGVVTLDLEDWEPYRLVPGDLLFARSGNTVGKTYLYRQEDGLCAYAGYLIRFQADPEQVTPWYLFSLTQTGYYKSWVEARKRVAGQPNINGKEYSSLQIPCPPLSRQQQFTTMVESLITSQNRRDASTERVDRLFNIILHRAFTGDLTAKWRESHMKELLQEMEQQAKALRAEGAKGI